MRVVRKVFHLQRINAYFVFGWTRARSFTFCSLFKCQLLERQPLRKKWRNGAQNNYHFRYYLDFCRYEQSVSSNLQTESEIPETSIQKTIWGECVWERNSVIYEKEQILEIRIKVYLQLLDIRLFEATEVSSIVKETEIVANDY